MSNNKVLLVSINYETAKGGVSRVAHLMASALPPSQVLSLYGNQCLNVKNVKYFQQRTLLFAWALLKYIIINRPSTILFDHVGPASILAVVPRFLLKKVIIFLHDEEAWKPVSARHAKGLNKASHLLCNSAYTFNKFVAHNPAYLPKTKVCLLAGVPADFEQLQAIGREDVYKNWFLNPTPYVVFVSRLWKEHRYKGYMELVAAFEIVKKSNPSFALRLAIIGSGDDVEALQESIKSAQLEDIVEIFSNIEDKELARFYQNSVALVFPSIREGFGFVFLEAMYFSKACIGVINQPAEEIIDHEKSGILLKDNLPLTIAEILEDIAYNNLKYKNMGIEGYKLYANQFTNSHFKVRFLDCID